MGGVLEGFAIVVVIAAVGYLAARMQLGQGLKVQEALSRLVFYISNPALMFVLLAESDLTVVFGVYAPAAILTALGTAVLYGALAVLLFRRNVGTVAVGAMSSSYVNAGNIGLPIALYAVGTTAPVVSVLVAQLLILAPMYLAVFSMSTPQDGSLVGKLARSFASPVTIATALGLVCALTGLQLPNILWRPVDVLAQSAVPLLLLLFGMSLHGMRPLRSKELVVDTLVATTAKLLLMPALAYAIGRFAFHIEGIELFGVVVMAALPTAQNVFLFASQYPLKAYLARDVVFLTSFLSFPVVLLLAFLMV